MSLGSIVQRLFPLRRARRLVELEPLHQRILRSLYRFGELEFERLQADIGVEHETLPGETLLALVKLEADGLVLRNQQSGRDRRQATYALTSDGRRVAGHLPARSSSTIDFHL